MNTAVDFVLEQAVQRYKMPEPAKSLLVSSNILLLGGVTAAGKDTLTQFLVKQGGYEHVVSHTTRSPRYNHNILEKNGVDYWFVTPAQMLQLVENRKLVEVKQVHGTLYYATAIDSVERVIAHQKRPILEIDVQGAQEIIAAVPSYRSIFLIPPDFDTWMLRLSARGKMSEEDRQRRLQSAKVEIQTALREQGFDIVINHEVDQTAVSIADKSAFTEASQATARKTAKSLLEKIS